MFVMAPNSPNDICLKTEEWRQFTPQGSAVPQSRWSNTYHLHLQCVRFKYPYFDPHTTVVEDNVRARMLDAHKKLTFCELGLSLYIDANTY